MECSLEDRRENWLKEKIYSTKENILYNNIPSVYLQTVNLSNVYYFKHFLKNINDFEAVNFLQLVNLRFDLCILFKSLFCLF